MPAGYRRRAGPVHTTSYGSISTPVVVGVQSTSRNGRGQAVARGGQYVIDRPCAVLAGVVPGRQNLRSARSPVAIPKTAVNATNARDTRLTGGAQHGEEVVC